MKEQQSYSPSDQQSSRFENYDLGKQLEILSSYQREKNCHSITLEQVLQEQDMLQMSQMYQSQNFPLRMPPLLKPDDPLRMMKPDDPLRMMKPDDPFRMMKPDDPLRMMKPDDSLRMMKPDDPLRMMAGQRLRRYIYEQRNRPKDNNIEFWRQFVAEFFTPNAKKKWCFSMYVGEHQTTKVPLQDYWQCGICNLKPARGLEANANVLPRLFQIKYESGMLEELLYFDESRCLQNSADEIILDGKKTVQESVFEKSLIVRKGHLRIVFSPQLKICLLEFCVWRHDEFILRRLLTPQVNQLRASAQKFQAYAQELTRSSNMNISELKNMSNMFVALAKQVVKASESPLTYELGFSNGYFRCLAIADTVDSMKDLIDYSIETGTGPIENLVTFPRRKSTQSVVQRQQLHSIQPEQQKAFKKHLQQRQLHQQTMVQRQQLQQMQLQQQTMVQQQQLQPMQPQQQTMVQNSNDDKNESESSYYRNLDAWIQPQPQTVVQQQQLQQIQPQQQTMVQNSNDDKNEAESSYWNLDEWFDLRK